MCLLQLKNTDNQLNDALQEEPLDAAVQEASSQNVHAVLQVSRQTNLDVMTKLKISLVPAAAIVLRALPHPVPGRMLTLPGTGIYRRTGSYSRSDPGHG